MEIMEETELKENNEEKSDGFEIMSGGKLKKPKGNKSVSEIAKDTVIEMISKIPYKRIFDEDQIFSNECWNCGMNCNKFKPKGEILNESERLVEENGKIVKRKVKSKRKNHKCTGRNSDSIGGESRRCENISIHEELKIIPDWIDELDDLDEDDVPKSDKQLKKEGKKTKRKKGRGIQK